MIYIIKPYVHTEHVELSISKCKLSKEAADTYRKLSELKHNTGFDLGLYPKAHIQELTRAKLAYLTQSLDTAMYLLLLGTVKMPVGMLKVRVVGGTGSVNRKEFNYSRRVN